MAKKKLTNKQIKKINDQIETMQAVWSQMKHVDVALKKNFKRLRISTSAVHKGPNKTESTYVIKFTCKSKPNAPENFNFSIKDAKSIDGLLKIYIKKLQKLVPEKIVPIVPITKNTQQNGKHS